MTRFPHRTVILGLAGLLAMPAPRLRADEPPAKEGEKKAQTDPRGRKNNDGQPPRMRGDGQMLSMMARRIAEALDLTPEQQKQLEGIVAKHREADANHVTGLDPKAAEQMEALKAELASAQKEGDEAKMNAIRARMSELTQPFVQARNAARDAFFADIVEILTPAQKERFETIKTQLGARGRGQSMMVNPRLLREAVMRLKLGPEQKAKIEALFEHFKDEMKPGKGVKGREERTGGERMEATRKLNENVMKELTKEQQEQVRKALQQGRASRGDRMGGRRGPPDKSNPDKADADKSNPDD